METKQTKRFTEEELGIIKNTFSDSDDLLKAMRKVFLQMPLTATDLSILSVNFNNKKNLLRIVRKTFLPELDPQAPLGQLIDLWMTIQFTDKSPELALPHLIARKILIEYIEQQLEGLEDGKYKRTIDFNNFTKFGKKTAEELYIDLIVRNTMINHTDMSLMQLEFMAKESSLTPEQIEELRKKNSSK